MEPQGTSPVGDTLLPVVRMPRRHGSPVKCSRMVHDVERDHVCCRAPHGRVAHEAGLQTTTCRGNTYGCPHPDDLQQLRQGQHGLGLDLRDDAGDGHADLTPAKRRPSDTTTAGLRIPGMPVARHLGFRDQQRVSVLGWAVPQYKAVNCRRVSTLVSILAG